MSRPDRPGELRDVTVEAISLVSKAANGEKFKIFKSAKPEEKEAPETVKKDERGLFRILKEFFTGSDETVEKGVVADTLNKNTAGSKLWDAFSAFMQVIGQSRYMDGDSKPETDPAKIMIAIDDFRNVVIEILLGKGEIEKSGRKISGSRLSKLKNIQAVLNEVLDGLDGVNTPKEAEDVTKEEVQKTVADTVKAANFEEIVKKALDPIIERIEKIENARGFSNRVPEDSAVEKSVNDFWEGIF